MLGARIPVIMNEYGSARLSEFEIPTRFDAAVQAGGYNSFHEMRLPVSRLVPPDAQTGMDDQEPV